ncbi:MAG TPA: HutD family protein [Clostridia bacterium]|nr:HutD family protein [Clostridia bacterium]
MSYSVEMIRRDEQSTSAWSGGTTTQLAIYPKNSEYKARNFKWRLSSAHVDIEESTFTSLPEIWRHIMIIDGEMKLLHEGHHSILLRPFEQDSFSGGWTTKSIGRATDFNLMLGQGCKGGLEAVFAEGESNVGPAANQPDNDIINITDAFYCASGSVIMSINKDEAYDLREGDLLLVNRQKSCVLSDMGTSFRSNGAAVIIRAWISY